MTIQRLTPRKRTLASISTLVGWNCPYENWKVVNETTGEDAEFDCKSWTCPVHGAKLAWRWRYRIGAVPWTMMVTLTNVPEDRHRAAMAWQGILRWLREKGVDTYARILEFGRDTGMRHWHVLVQGPGFLDVFELSRQAEKAGLGKIVHAAAIKSREGSVAYVLKYVVKDLGVHDPRANGWRRITVSSKVPSWNKVKSMLDRNLGREAREGEKWHLVTPLGRQSRIS